MRRGSRAVLVIACATLACGTSSSSAPPDAAASDGGGGAAVGAPCLPEQELNPMFASFRESEVTVDVSSAQCASGVCLVNHFRGRVSCPYGQDASGQPVAGEP